MKLVRRYMNAREDASQIARECVRDGSSDGWSGTLEMVEEITAILAPFGIRYVDDMSGEWKGGMRR